jgi:hypothetical protein
MKKKKFILPIFLCGYAFNLPTDYRDTYVGTYNCVSRCQSLNSTQTEIITNIETTTIVVSKNSIDSVLNISMGLIEYQVKLQNGHLFSYPKGGRWGGRFFGVDSLGFSVSLSLAPNGCKYIGKKIE